MHIARPAGSDRFVLPRNLGAADTQTLFELCDHVRKADGVAVLDASNLEFVDPLGLAVLGSHLGCLPHCQVHAEWMPTKIAGYLDRMGLFSHCTLHGVEVSSRSRNDLQTSLVELTRVSDSSDAQGAAHRLAVAITGQLTNADPEAPRDEHTGHNQFDRYNHPLQYSLSELLDNALTHARREGRTDAAVWVAAQFYSARDLVRVAVVDNGCGMLATLRHHPSLTAPTHEAAIVAALQPRVSCNRDVGVNPDSVNQGVGLTTTYRIARAAGGGMTIVSGSGYHNALGVANRLRSPAYWQGVAISFTVRRSSLPNVVVGEQLPVLDLPPVQVRFE